MEKANHCLACANSTRLLPAWISALYFIFVNTGNVLLMTSFWCQPWVAFSVFSKKQNSQTFICVWCFRYDGQFGQPWYLVCKFFVSLFLARACALVISSKETQLVLSLVSWAQFPIHSHCSIKRQRHRCLIKDKTNKVVFTFFSYFFMKYNTIQFRFEDICTFNAAVRHHTAQYTVRSEKCDVNKENE